MASPEQQQAYQDGLTRASVHLVKEFCESNFDQFQEWLGITHEIESSEAEVILGHIND